MGNAFSENSFRKSSSSPKSRSLASKFSFGNKKRTRDSLVSTTTSHSSSEITYHYVEGRRFNENSKYSLPNDDEEVDRLHMQHYLQRYVWQGNYCSPVHRVLRNPGARVLDVGCGPGTWLLEMAFDYPDAQFTGIDIDPIYPKEIKPINVNFEEADLTQGLPFDDDTFDFVVMRNMVNVLTVEDWEQALKELERVCKPGGFVECLEFELPAHRLGKITKRIVEAYGQIMRTKNIDIKIAPHIKDLFSDHTRLTNIENQIISVPMGSWGGKVGKIIADDSILLTKALAPFLIPLWGIGSYHYQEYTSISEKELEEGKAYCNIHTIYAQKYEPYRYI